MRPIIGLDQHLPIFSLDAHIPLREIYHQTRDLRPV